MNSVKLKPRQQGSGLDKLNVGDTIRIPTADDAEKYYISASGGNSPSVVLIDKSRSPGTTKLNKYDEVPKIPFKSRIPVLQRSTGHSSFLKTNTYGQPLSASSRKSSVTNHKPSLSYPADNATYENLLNQATTNSLPVLPAIGLNGSEQVKNPPVPTSNPSKSVQPCSLPVSKSYYHVTTAKPVFQMKAEYNSMLQKYASQQNSSSSNYHMHAPGAPCKSCGRHVSQPRLNPAMEQSYVQQWLVDPNHPYQIPAPATGLSQSTALPQPLTTQQQVGPLQTTHQKPDDSKHSVPTVPLVFNSPANNRKQVPAKQQNVPIRYTQAPTTQIVNKISGKLLSPEDALKRTLKRKKIPPLTKRNSLRSIFSDNSSNLEKIAEGDEERESDIQSGSGSHTGSQAGKKKRFEPGTDAYRFHALLCRLLLDGGALALLTVFNTVYAPLTLSENLSKPQLHKSLQRMKSQGGLSDEHWELLYPKKKSTVSADNFSFTLLLILLKSVCHLSPPYPNGWEELPLSKDMGLSADLARITWFRKHLVTLQSLDEQDFLSLWTQLSAILLRLSESSCSVVVKRVQREVLEPDAQIFYVEALNKTFQEQVAVDTREQPVKSDLPRNSSTKKSALGVSKHPHSAMSSKSGTFVVSSGNESARDRLADTTSDGMAGRNVLLMSFNVIIDTVKVEHCIDHLVSHSLISKDQKSKLSQSTLPPERRMKELVEVLLETTTNPYKVIIAALQSHEEYSELAQALQMTFKRLSKQLFTTDVREYMKDHLRRHYHSRFKQIKPYFWDPTIVTDLKSYYVQLDITDAKGLKSNLPRSRRYQIEKIFVESSRPHRVLLEGQPGSGKTLYCNKLAYDWSRGDCWLSFDFVVLLDMNLIQDTLEDAIYNQLQFYDGEVMLRPDDLISVLNFCQRRLLFIIDTYNGFEEISPQILDLLQGKVLEESSIFLTCLPEQVSRLLPLCNRRLINLGLDKSRQDQLMTRYAMLNRGQAEEYASQLSEKVNELAKENEYMLKIPLLLNLLSLMAQNEELSERTSSLTLQLKTVFDIYPFIYCIQRGMQYDPDNPPNDVMYALKQLQTLALETVLEKPATIIPLEHVQQNYGCKLLMQMDLLEPFEWRRDNKYHQMLTFRSRALQEFMAALRLSQLPGDQIKKHLQKIITEPMLRSTLVYCVGCIHHASQPSSNAVLMAIFNQLGKINMTKHKANKDEFVPLGDFALSLECVNECDNKKEVVRAISQSLPPRLLVLPDQIHSTTTISGLNMILEKNFSRVSHVSVTLNPSTHFNMDIVQELAYSIRRSTSVTDLYVSYASTELLTFFLSHITSDYRANLLTIVCESKATSSVTEKLTASTYTQLKSCISSLSGITTFTLVGCRNSLTLRNIIRHLPPILATLEIKECLFDSVSALDISSYLERASGLFVLSLEKCELADGATEMNLFKGLRSNKSLVNLRLRGSSLNVQALKVLCEALKFTRALKHLDLTQLELSTPVCSALASAINVSCSLKDLKLTTSQVCSEGLTLLGETEKEGFKLIQE